MRHEDKEEYAQKREKQLTDWKELLTRIEERAGQTAGTAREELHKVAEELRSRDIITRVRLSELKDSTSEAWEEVKFGFESAWSELEQSVVRARSHFHA
jgi:hypothetical protein